MTPTESDREVLRVWPPGWFSGWRLAAGVVAAVVYGIWWWWMMATGRLPYWTVAPFVIVTIVPGVLRHLLRRGVR